MAETPVTITIEVPPVAKLALEALRDVTEVCLIAEEAGQTEVSIVALRDILEEFLNGAGA